ncbi:hypothetical protein KJ762_08655 [bacterium]|nr:hypothetical protein [bacterium]MBU1063591.1 hypothetical protein [bacterium]MBU1634563.1 hypothetical protein [bacterium]
MRKSDLPGSQPGKAGHRTISPVCLKDFIIYDIFPDRSIPVGFPDFIQIGGALSIHVVPVYKNLFLYRIHEKIKSQF